MFKEYIFYLHFIEITAYLDGNIKNTILFHNEAEMIFEENNSSYFIFVSNVVMKFFDGTFGLITQGNISLNKNSGGSINFF